ncbi:MAG TPA: PAS domain S-box protein, partial [Spirochaetota bacterium]|nr:PAS domain S-box protein [Spirochaetota bacterium]
MPATVSSLDELTRAGTLLTQELDFKSLISIIAEQTLDISLSDLACLYLAKDPEDNNSDLQLAYKRGRYDVPSRITASSELVDFIRESDETVVLTDRKRSPFLDILCNEHMHCGIAMPLSTPKIMVGILVLNSIEPGFYNREKFNFLDSFSRLAGGMLHNSRMFKQLRDYLREIEELHLYQESIFSSMTNLLITTDNSGEIQYYNTVAEERFGLSDEQKGKKFDTVFKDSMNRKIINAINSSIRQPKEMPGIEGIFRDEEKEMDFSLNLSPLKGRRGKHQGLTLLFTDQTRERELEEKMERVVEERRVIKDMFSRYLSQEIVQTLMEQPHLVKPGGDKKEAT